MDQQQLELCSSAGDELPTPGDLQHMKAFTVILCTGTSRLLLREWLELSELSFLVRREMLAS